jgi:hypothetical protein
VPWFISGRIIPCGVDFQASRKVLSGWTILNGRIIPEFPDLPYREVVISPYRFFYGLKGETVWVVAVWHGAQMPKEPL